MAAGDFGTAVAQAVKGRVATADLDDATAALIEDEASTSRASLDARIEAHLPSLAANLAVALDGQADVKAMATASAMSSPPAISLSSTTTLSGSSLIGPADTRFRTSGAETFIGTVASKTFLLPKAPVGFGAPPVASEYPWRVEFDFDGSAFEFIARCSAVPKFRIWVDSQPNSIAPVNYTLTDNSAQFCKVNFGSRAYRRIVLEGEHNWYFGGVQFLPTDTIMRPRTARGPRLAVVGDSYAVSYSGVNTRMLGYVPTMARILGVRDFSQSTAAGGTGFINPGAYAKYLDRLADVTAIAPDIVIATGTVNDSASTAAAVKSAAKTYVDAVRAALPAALVVLTGTLYAAAPTATFAQHTAALGEAADEEGVPFIDPSTWFTGTGTNTAPTGDGNADYYRALDTVHPTPAGHLYLGQRMAGAVQRILRGEMITT